MELENIAVVRRWFDDVWNHRREQTIDDVMTAESFCVADGRTLTGPDEFKEQMYAPMLAAFPDLHVDIDDVLAHGEQVVVHWRAAGTHSGDGVGIPPTGRTVLFRGVTWLYTRDGKFVKGQQYSNIPEVLRSLAPPPPGT